jgi:protein gp37
MATDIEWCDETLNPLGWGCYGPGGTPEKPQICEGCYALRWAKKSPWCRCEKCREFVPHWHPEALAKPLRWKKHRAIFWQDMGDLWHQAIPREQILETLKICWKTIQHTHIFLTKNPERYLEFVGEK